MGRNYFSKHGGPYFINSGFSQHDHSHDTPGVHKDIQTNKNLFYFIFIGFVSVLVTIGIVLTVLH
jgi:hypothetical protein